MTDSGLHVPLSQGTWRPGMDCARCAALEAEVAALKKDLAWATVTSGVKPLREMQAEIARLTTALADEQQGNDDLRDSLKLAQGEIARLTTALAVAEEMAGYLDTLETPRYLYAEVILKKYRAAQEGR